jgi:hypothetical protein
LSAGRSQSGEIRVNSKAGWVYGIGGRWYRGTCWSRRTIQPHHQRG